MIFPTMKPTNASPPFEIRPLFTLFARIVYLCLLGLSGSELAVAILAELFGKLPEKARPKCRQTRHKAIKSLVKRGVLTASPTGSLSLRSEVREAANELCPLLENTLPREGLWASFLSTGMPEFNWNYFDSADRSWLYGSLRAAVIFEAAHAWKREVDELKEKIPRVPEDRWEREVFRLAGMLQRLRLGRGLLEDHLNATFGNMLPTDPNTDEPVRNPTAVLLEWQANSPRHKK